MCKKAERQANPNGFKVNAIYYSLRQYAHRKHGLGQYNTTVRPDFFPLTEENLTDFPDPKTVHAQSEIELTLLLDDAKGDVRRYLHGKAEDRVATNDQLQKSHKWSRTAFAEIKKQASRWIARQYPEEAGTLMNRVHPPEFLAEITDLYLYNAASDKLCSILFAPDEGDWVLLGPKSVVIARKLDRPAGPGPRLCLHPDEVLAALDGHIGESGTPLNKPEGGNFWLYTDFAY